MKNRTLLFLSLLALTLAQAGAAVRYVNVANPSPAPPYTEWDSAARNIQDAVDVARDGDEIVVTNGVYATGQIRVVDASKEGFSSNRVAVTKSISLVSVNGPQATIIDGGGTVRCVYLGSGGRLIGFTLTNGVANSFATFPFSAGPALGGGVWCANSSAIVLNCTITGNSATNGLGGGAFQGTLSNCTLTGNSAGSGGGAFQSTLRNCTLTGNSANSEGGGVHDCFLTNCTLSGNSMTGNFDSGGGGSYDSVLANCVLTGNSAQLGGGALLSKLYNCTLAGNAARTYGGGVHGGYVYNCIVYHNTAGRMGDNYRFGDFNYSCTTPLPSFGVGNIAADPQLASTLRLSAGSPCRGAGSAIFGSLDIATGLDIDGEAWADPRSIGCDEFHPGTLTGPLDVAIAATYTNVATGFAVNFTAQINGRVSASRWEFGNGTVVSNRPVTAHAWVVPGDYPVVLRAYNETYPEGVDATVIVHVGEEIIYVSQHSGNPAPPYSSWATAATNIQDAVDAASVVGAVVLVTNGIYQTGGRAVYGTMTNRVAVTKPVTVRSVNGPEVTVIRGYQVPGFTNGDGAIRCVYLTNGAVLTGFTLTNGATRADRTDREYAGGGVWCEPGIAVISNCVIVGNSAVRFGGGAYSGRLNNCILAFNRASMLDPRVDTFGGGAYICFLTNCTLQGNSAGYGGGGSSDSVLDNCVLTGNSAVRSGGGSWRGTLNNCTLTGNSAGSGGGAAGGAALYSCTLASNSARGLVNSDGGGALLCQLYNCTLTGNSAEGYGGGVAQGWLLNTTLTGNTASLNGGGASASRLNKCTVTGNSAQANGGGVHGGFLTNCIVYHNTATQDGFNYVNGTFNYSCTTPLPSDGVGNIDDEPRLADPSHLSETSPCRGRGNPAYATGVDIDGQPWAFPPSMGCDEFRPITGPLTVAIRASCMIVPAGYAVDLTSQIEGHTTAIRWNLGDGTVVSNQLSVTRSWATSGEHTVVLMAFNDTHPEGVTASLTVFVSATPDPVLYVSLDSVTPVPPYVSWNTAARTIQQAVDVLCTGGTVIVSNGVYGPVTVSQPVTIRSLNGPEVTRIDGGGAARCVYLGSSGAVVSGFTLTRGAADAGGGVWCADANTTVSNCVIVDNNATTGGGAYSGTLFNCVLTENSAHENGGGACASTLHNCILEGNSAGVSGGGAFGSTLNNSTVIGNSANQTGGGVGGGNRFFGIVSRLNNCIVYYNFAGQDGDNFDSFSELNGSCTTPLPFLGRDNFENRPRLVDLVGVDFRLQPDSPCINAGLNAYAAGDIDLSGNSRLVGGTVDVGAYEFQSPQSLISYAWLQQYGLPIDGSADDLDLDGDLLSNIQEWRAGTDPNDALSALRLLPLVVSDLGLVTWESVPGRTYTLERSDTLGDVQSFVPVATGIPAAADSNLTTYFDSGADIFAGSRFYRVRVD